MERYEPRSPLRLMPWERYWEVEAEEEFMRDDPDEANHPIRVRMGLEALRVVKRMVKERRAPRVLDTGCGTAIDYPRLRDLGFAYEGLEPIPKFIEKAKELNPGINIMQERIWEIPRRDRFYDVTWCKGVVQHLPPGTYFEGVDELWRVTDKLMLISTNRIFFKGPNLSYRDKEGPYVNHYNFYEFLNYVKYLPNAVTKHTSGFIKPGEEERAEKEGIGAHTLFIVYRIDFFRKHALEKVI